PLAIVAMGQTHAILVGSLDLSVGAMVTLGVVIASYLIRPDAPAVQLLLGIGVIVLSGVGLGLINAGLVLWFKIPAIIATLATLSVLSGISLTLRDTPGGVINRDFTSWLKTGIGPIPIAFIVVVAGAVALDYWLCGAGGGVQAHATRRDRAH